MNKALAAVLSSFVVWIGGLPAVSAQQPASPPETPLSAGVALNAPQKAPNLNTIPTTEESPAYEIKESVEFGGRATSYTGNTGTWDSYVNLGSGPRLLEYSLSMHNVTHSGLLFDDLTFNSFGYGGDPNDVSRLYVQKGKIYNLNASFRRDVNIFDYNLLANPLNPPTSNPDVPILNSPHEFLMTRRISDVQMHLFPTGRIQLRGGWSRVSNQGTTFSSFHQGNEALLDEPTSYINDNYNGGISFRVLPRTSLSYDQSYTFYKGDTTAQLAPAGSAAGFGVPTFSLPNGTPVSLGFPFNTPAGYPCATPVLGTGFVNSSCNGFTSYARYGRVRNSYWTEQFSSQTHYWQRLNLAARVVYSNAESAMPNYASLFSGLETRTATVVQNIVAPPGGGASSERLSLTADLDATFRVTDKINLIEQFRYTNFRIPGNWLYLENSYFGPALGSVPNIESPAACPTVSSPGCPQHTSSSAADVITDSLNDFLRQGFTLNTVEVEYEFTPQTSGYMGYRFGQRNITDINTDNQVSVFYPTLPNRGACAGQPLVNGICTVATVLEAENTNVQINSQTALLGFAAHPTDRWRLSGDLELMSADNAFTRISPRHLELYKVKANYRPTDSMNLGAALYIRENRNTASDIDNLQHNRSYSVNAEYMPAEAKWGVDATYTYNDIFSQTNICYVSTPTPAGALSCGTPFLSGVSVYTEASNFGSASISLKPVRRVAATVGYTITSSNGSTLILNPIAPTGPLTYKYQLPLAGVAIELEKHTIFKTGWNYYDYNESSAPGPALPRSFRGNVFTLSIRYIL